MNMDQEENKGFDLLVTHRDPKTGMITHSNPYTLRVVAGADGGKMRLWERPAHSGNIWDKNGKPVGRYEKSMVDGKMVSKFIPGAKHKEWVPPLTQDQVLAKSLMSKDSRIAELEKELASIKAEKENVKESKASKGS